MRNNKAYKPAVHNSFRKSDRVYPESRSIYAHQQKPNQKMLAEEEQPQCRIANQIQTTKAYQTFTIPRQSNQFITRYSFTVQNPSTITGLHGDDKYIDPTCIWFANLDNAVLKKQKRSIKFYKS